MSTISLDDIKYIAHLARIAVSDDQAATLQRELDTILGYVKQLDTANTEGFDPTYQVTGLKNVMREDEIINYGVSGAELLQNAPNQQDGQLKVPKVL